MGTFEDREAPTPSPSSQRREQVFPVKRFLFVFLKAPLTRFDEISRTSILNEAPNALAELKSQRVPATAY